MDSTGMAIAILDAFPVARGHSLVLPKAHRARVEEMGAAECSEVFELARRVAARVSAVHGDSLIAVHNGPRAGQEIPHAHVHIVPRSEGDGAGPIHSMFGGPHSRAPDAELAAELGAIRAA
ncbi:MAG: HIT domain-containing protein [Thaumarchaeota archaeon]|nr:HIT domain-containing protein [Nitrososphaerota archaeon]